MGEEAIRFLSRFPVERMNLALRMLQSRVI